MRNTANFRSSVRCQYTPSPNLKNPTKVWLQPKWSVL